MSEKRCGCVSGEFSVEFPPQRDEIGHRAVAFTIQPVSKIARDLAHATASRSWNTRNRSAPATAPTICAPMKPGASIGRIPANVSLIARPSVMAGLANEVDAVNQ